MLKKSITYTNPFTEEEVTEEHFFHISKADLVEMEMEEHKAEYTDKTGKKLTGMQAKLQKIADSEDGKAIIAEFKDIVRRAYGKKDGDRFLKSKEIWEEFASTEAFSQLIFEICTNADASAEFIRGVIPSNLEQIAAEVVAQAEKAERPTTGPIAEEAAAMATPAAGGPDGTPVDTSTQPVQPGRILTQAEVTEMDATELQSGLATGRYRLS